MAVGSLGNILVIGGQSIVAGGILLLLAMETAAAADRERHDDALPFLQIARRPRLDDFAHEFMAKHVAGFHGRDDTIIKVQVGPTDGGAGDLDDRLVDTCDNMKASGILIYTVTFDDGVDQDTKDLYEDCASTVANYHDAPTQQDLEDVFEQIARELSNLHIKQ